MPITTRLATLTMLPFECMGHSIDIVWHCPASEVVELPVNVTTSIYQNGVFTDTTVQYTLASNANTISIPLAQTNGVVVAQSGIALDASAYSVTDGVLAINASALGGDISIAAYAPRPRTRAGGQAAHTMASAGHASALALRGVGIVGAQEAPEDVERKGLGTPATRAGVIEKLIKSGFVERKQKLLVPTEKGSNLIAVLPDELKSPLLTAVWEHRLKEVERGQLAPAAFMDDIAALIHKFVENIPHF